MIILLNSYFTFVCVLALASLKLLKKFMDLTLEKLYC